MEDATNKMNSINHCYYRPPTKLQEGNVFSHVCLSVILSTGGWEGVPVLGLGSIPSVDIASHAGFRHRIIQTCMRLYVHISDVCRMSVQIELLLNFP